MNIFSVKKTFFLSAIMGSSILCANMALATGGITCISKNSKLNFDIKESSDRTPLSAKVFYKTDPIAGEDGSVHSLELENTKSKKPIISSQEDNQLLIIIYSGSSVVSTKINLENSKGKAMVMMADENKKLDMNCVRE